MRTGAEEYAQQTSCHECNLTLHLQALSEGDKASCPRCGYVITRVHKHATSRMLVFSLTAMIFLVMSNLFGFIALNARGLEREITLFDISQVLFSLDQLALSLLLFMVTIVIPVLFSVLLLWLVVLIKLGKATHRAIILLRVIEFMRFWNMAEIFFLGIIISMIKVVALADINVGVSLWCYALFSVFLVAALLHTDKHQLAAEIRRISFGETDASIDHGSDRMQCHHCGTRQHQSRQHCQFCHGKLSHKNSLQRTWALLITGILLYIPANILPMLTSNELGNISHKTIIGGVVELWDHGSYFITLIIFVASIVVPLAKFLVLITLCLSQQFSIPIHPRHKMAIYRATEFVGRWSMIDVFVIAFLAGLIQLGNLMNISPGPAVLAFAGMVVFTMLAASSIDSTLFWNEHGRPTKRYTDES